MFGLRSVIVMGVALAFGAAGPAYAQLEPSAQTGSRFVQDPEAVSPDDARKITKRFAKCILNRRTDQSLALLRASDYSQFDYANLGDAEYLLENTLLMENCLGRAALARQRSVGMRISNTALRSALVEEAYLKAYNNDDAPIDLGPNATEQLDNRFFVQGDGLADARSVSAYADCVVFNATTEAHALIHTDVASKEERTAINAIVPALGSCLSAGSQMKLDVASIRALVADGLWARMEYGVEGSQGAAE